MAKLILGVDIGYDTLKLALMSGTQIRKTAIVSMPSHLVREGRIVSTETMGELIRSTMKENNMHCNSAALVLSNETIFLRSITMPLMTEDQLNYNLPYEFRDYITDELKNYWYDYALISISEKQEEEGAAGQTMELLAAAVSKAAMQEYRELLHKAGLKLVKAAPTVSAFQSLIRTQGNADPDLEYCILDLGYQSIRMYMFRGDRHMVTRVLEIGMSTLDQVLAENYNVDIHLAHTYLLSNYEDCQNKDYCSNAYNNITVELMRALNFYRFSNPESHLNDIWICGGGAMIRPLQDLIAETLDLKIHRAEELLPPGTHTDDAYSLLQAIGITLNDKQGGERRGLLSK